MALEHLDANRNEFAVLPAAITALSRLTELVLGRNAREVSQRTLSDNDWDARALDVCALGNLSGFPMLCRLHFEYCEVKLCESMLGAVRHASLASIAFRLAHPAPGCAPVVLQLSQALNRLRRGSVLRFYPDDLQDRYAEQVL